MLIRKLGFYHDILHQLKISRFRNQLNN